MRVATCRIAIKHFQNTKRIAIRTIRSTNNVTAILIVLYFKCRVPPSYNWGVLVPQYSNSSVVQVNCAVSSFLLRFGQSAVRFSIWINNIDLSLQCCSDYVECFTDVHQHSFESIDFFPMATMVPYVRYC